MSTQTYTFGVVGVGPRGSYALECLTAALTEAPDASKARFLLFDDADHIGAGPVYQLDQPSTNWINISERALQLDARTECNLAGTVIPGFPSYHTWINADTDPWPSDRADTFPPRALIGKYLHARTLSLVSPLEHSGLATLVPRRIEQISYEDEQWVMTDAEHHEWKADEVLLAIGHQPTTTDEQILDWERHARQYPALLLFANPYAVNTAAVRTQAAEGSVTVAIRGYGLAMMDVVRLLANEFGEFTPSDTDDCGLEYRPTGSGRLELTPFSLNGLPMSPKPLTPAMDDLFAPTTEDIEQLSTLLTDKRMQATATDQGFLIDAISPITTKVFLALPERHESAPANPADLEALIKAWLHNPETEHPAIANQAHPPEAVLRHFVSIAEGRSAPSVDYCLGQVWRHCHPTIYASLSYNDLSDEARAATIALDERVKRYSFGPPVESLRQLCALATAGVLNLDYTQDPDINRDPTGWTLSTAERSVTATVMIDSVLDGPRLKDVKTPLITSLLRQKALQPVHDELGIATNPDATVQSAHPAANDTLSILGRLAKGTVIGVDAILECYGERPKRWAEGARTRQANQSGQSTPNTSEPRPTTR